MDLAIRFDQGSPAAEPQERTAIKVAQADSIADKGTGGIHQQEVYGQVSSRMAPAGPRELNRLLYR